MKKLTKAEIRNSFDKSMLECLSMVIKKVDSINVKIDKKRNYTTYIFSAYNYYLSINISSSIKFYCRIGEEKVEQQYYYIYESTSDFSMISKNMKKDFKKLILIIVEQEVEELYIFLKSLKINE